MLSEVGNSINATALLHNSIVDEHTVLLVDKDDAGAEFFKTNSRQTLSELNEPTHVDTNGLVKRVKTISYGSR